MRNYATVAQSVEQLIRNQQVAGSSPASSSKRTGHRPVLFSYIRLNINSNAAHIAWSRISFRLPGN